jgi:predicted Mrr-cat superfamily restriction endonuclease
MTCLAIFSRSILLDFNHTKKGQGADITLPDGEKTEAKNTAYVSKEMRALTAQWISDICDGDLVTYSPTYSTMRKITTIGDCMENFEYHTSKEEA